MRLDQDASVPHGKLDLMGQRFRNPWPGAQVKGMLSALKWGVTRTFSRLPKDPPSSAFRTVAPSLAVPRAARDELRVTWVGHSTLLVQIAGLNVLTDPVWSRRASPVQWAGPIRVVPPGVKFEQLPPIDLVLVSHNHYDHLDARTIERLAASWPEAQWVVPLGVAPLVRKRGARHLTELAWWAETSFGDLAVKCTPAQHFSQRGPLDRNRTLWCGWALQGGDHRLFFAGDTGYHPVFGEIAARFGPFDVACLPVGAYEPRWFMRPMHMNPEDALKAFADMRLAHPGADGGVMLAMHWGTFKLTDEALDEPPERTRRVWRRAGLPEDQLWVLAHGETRIHLRRLLAAGTA
jgi:N-acyl-phosphatidylethanolamine-hydrolysing phospholipase D